MTMHRAFHRGLSAAAFVLICSGCAARGLFDPDIQAAPTPPNWQSSFGVDEPLVGSIYSVSDKNSVSFDTLAKKLATADIVLLGEQHDNPDHHMLQARVLRALGETRRPQTVAFEMITTEQAASLGACFTDDACTPADVRKATNWDTGGWPEWELYAPVFDAAFENKTQIVGADISRKTIRTISFHGVDALEPVWQRAYALDRPVPEFVYNGLAEEIREAHCGVVTEEMLPNMVSAQYARDAHMAAVLGEHCHDDSATGPTVLIAGFGHVRTDRAVPVQLPRFCGGKKTLSVAFVEVKNGLDNPVDYAERFNTRELPFDYVWFTPRVDETDPCEEFKQQLEELKRRHAQSKT